MGMQNLEVLRGSALWFWEVSCVKVVEICSNIEPVDAVLRKPIIQRYIWLLLSYLVRKYT